MTDCLVKNPPGAGTKGRAMVDVPPEPDAKPDLPESGPPPIPGWVKVALLVISILLLALLGATLLGGNHGPGRHLNSADHVDHRTTAAGWSNTAPLADQSRS